MLKHYKKETAGTDEEITERIRQAYQPANFTNQVSLDSTKSEGNKDNAYSSRGQDSRSGAQQEVSSSRQVIKYEENSVSQAERPQEVERKAALDFEKSAQAHYQVDPQSKGKTNYARYPASERAIDSVSNEGSRDSRYSKSEDLRASTQQDGSLSRQGSYGENSVSPSGHPQKVASSSTLDFGKPATEKYQGESRPKGTTQHERYPASERSIRNVGSVDNTYSNKAEGLKSGAQQDVSASKQDISYGESSVSQGMKGSQSGFKEKEERHVIRRNAELLEHGNSHTDEPADTIISGEAQQK